MTYHQLIALVLFAVFYIAYFAKMLVLRGRGIRATILGKNTAERLLLLVTYGGAVIQCLSVFFPKTALTLPVFPAMTELGLILMALGNAAFIAAMATMKNNWRAGFKEDQNTSLVTGGIYSYSRNPAFLGFDLLYLGCALAFFNILNLCILILAVALFHIQILSEEKFLIDSFGGEYVDYCSKTLRYLGRKSST